MRLVTKMLVVVIVLLSGCGGLSGGEPTSTEDPTLSETEMSKLASGSPEEAPTSEPDTPDDSSMDEETITSPPGISDGEIVNGTLLARAHTKSLKDSNFTIRSLNKLVAANGTEVLNTTSVRNIGSNRDQAYLQLTVNENLPTSPYTAGAQVTNWYNETDRFVQFQYPERVDYERYTNQSEFGSSLSQETWIRSLYKQAESVNISSQNGVILLNFSTPAVVRPGVNSSGQQVLMQLREDGQVISYRIDFVGQLTAAEDVMVNGTTIARFQDVGSTAVTPPDWVSQAENASGSNAD